MKHGLTVIGSPPSRCLRSGTRRTAVAVQAVPLQWGLSGPFNLPASYFLDHARLLP
jgi:hypothetical protein